MTTIKVETSVRDRLKVEAIRRGVTIGTLLESLVEIGEREARFAEIKAAIDATPPSSMADYATEAQHWDQAFVDPTP